MRSRLIASCVAVLVVAMTPAATAHETEWKRCGDKPGEGAGWYNVRADHVSCNDARAVARKYWNNGGPEHVRVDGVSYHCREKQIGDEVWRVRCNGSGERRVRFKYGA